MTHDKIDRMTNQLLSAFGFTSYDSDFLPAINNKANTLANMGKYDEAISLYAEVLGKNPSYTTAKQNLELLLSEMPQKNSGIIQKQTPQLEENNSSVSKQSKNYEQIKLQKEKSTNFFEQVDSMLSSIVSIFGISN